MAQTYKKKDLPAAGLTQVAQKLTMRDGPLQSASRCVRRKDPQGARSGSTMGMTRLCAGLSARALAATAAGCKVAAAAAGEVGRNATYGS